MTIGATHSEKFDHYHTNNPGQQAVVQPAQRPTAQVTMLEMVKTMVNEEVEGDDEKDPEQSIKDLMRVFANEVARRFDRGKKRITSNSQKAAKKPAPQLSMSRTTGSQSPPNLTSASRLEPAYHFESPCENSALVTQVWNKTLDTTITISP
jgi:hypothetical protein